MSELAALLTAAGVLLSTCGGGIAFVWNNVDARLRAQAAKLEACEQAHSKATTDMTAVTGRLRHLGACTGAVAAELRRLDPRNPLLSIVSAALREAFGIEPTTPAEMRRLLEELKSEPFP